MKTKNPVCKYCGGLEFGKAVIRFVSGETFTTELCRRCLRANAPYIEVSA